MRRGPFFLCFLLFKTTKICFGSTKMEINFLPGTAFHTGKKIRKNDFAISEKFSCYAPDWAPYTRAQIWIDADHCGLSKSRLHLHGVPVIQICICAVWALRWILINSLGLLHSNSTSLFRHSKGTWSWSISLRCMVLVPMQGFTDQLLHHLIKF